MREVLHASYAAVWPPVWRPVGIRTLPFIVYLLMLSERQMALSLVSPTPMLVAATSTGV